MRIFIVFATVWLSAAGLGAAPLPQEEPCSAHEVTLPLPPCGSCTPSAGPTIGYKSKGRHPTTAEQAIIDAALAKIAAWEAACPDLPTVPGPPGVAGRKASEVLGGVGFCIELNPKETAGASTNPPPGTYTPNPPHIEVVSGERIQINPQYVANPSTAHCMNLAIALVHEAAHVEDPNLDAENANELEKGPYDFQAGYMCKLFECTSDSLLQGVICHSFQAVANKIAGKPNCLTLPPCEHCPVNVDEQPKWNDGIIAFPEYLQGRAENVYYSLGIGGGPGTFSLNPSSKEAWARVLNSAGASLVVAIDFATEVPNFVPTAFHPVEDAVETIGIAGYDETTGDGMLMKLQLDFTSTPSFVLTTLYTGSGFGIPLDVFSFTGATSRVFVLDDAGSISLVRLVPGTCTTLATTSDAASLADCGYLHGLKLTDQDTGLHLFTVIATERSSEFYLNTVSDEGALVHGIDRDLDGDFEEVREL